MARHDTSGHHHLVKAVGDQLLGGGHRLELNLERGAGRGRMSSAFEAVPEKRSTRAPRTLTLYFSSMRVK